ncbi:MAG: hypothetical protein ACLUJM_11190 [Finegoldia sp.]|uniref:hypothetical protein n=1 Tax=Finegoldia sp. TaxID=1981334 RepID=UPI003996B4F0
MTEYQIYQIITTILFSLALLILAYDMGCRIRPPYNRIFGLIRFIVAVILMIVAIYTAGQIDNAKEQQNAKESNQHFEIKRADEKYITNFQQEFLQNIIDVQTKNTKSKEILLIPVDNNGYIGSHVHTEQLKELEKDNYYKRNKEKFEKSLEDNPVKAKTLMRILQNDLNNDFTISTKLVKEANGIENQWIVISWK